MYIIRKFSQNSQFFVFRDLKMMELTFAALYFMVHQSIFS